MSAADTAIAEAPAEPVPLAPEAIAELEAAPPQAAPAAQVAERTLPFDVDHLGLLRRSVLDHLLDTEGPQSVAQILASMPPGTTRGSAESAIKREYDAGRIERVGAGLYVLGKPKPPNQPKPAPPDPVHNDQWFAWLDEWKASDQWKGLATRPARPGVSSRWTSSPSSTTAYGSASNAARKPMKLPQSEPPPMLNSGPDC